MIKIENLSVRVQDKQILKNINLTIADGENICILGQNGCGKTTLLKAIAGLITYEGKISIDDVDIQTLKRKDLAKKLSMMSQFTNVAFDYSVYETVMMGRYSQLKSKSLFPTVNSEDRKIVEDALKLSDLYELSNRSINSLSGGQLQRVFLAKNLAQNPDILLLDEPNNHLDLKNQIELINYLREWSKSKNKNVIGVFHDLPLALSLTDQVIFMKEGQIVKQGLFTDIATKSLLEEVFEVQLLDFYQKQSDYFKDIRD